MKKNYSAALKFLAIILFGVLPILMMGQEAGDKASKKSTSFSRYWFANINAGISLAHTDVSNNLVLPPTETWRMGFGANAGWQFLPFLGARAQVSGGWLNGEKSKMAEHNYRDVYFDADYFDYHLAGTISFTNMLFGYKERLINFYGIVGFGQIQFKTKLKDSETGFLYAKNGYSGDVIGPSGKGDKSGFFNRTMVWSVPAGIGFAIRASEKVDITLESQWKWTDTERLDGVIVKRDYPVKNDMYSYTSLGITYKFGFSGGLKKMEKDFELVTLKATPDPVEAIGDSVEITFSGTVPPKYFDKKSAMYLVPVLTWPGGEAVYDPITLKGEDVIGEGQMINYKNGGSFSYKTTVPYEPGMNASDLVVVPVIYQVKEKTYANKDEIKEQAKFVELPARKLADGVIYTSRMIMNDQLTIAGAHGYQKEVIVTKKAMIYFFVNRFDLNWRAPLNKLDENKSKLTEISEFIAGGWKIRDIQIDGWASPEGEETFNNDLSEKRTNTTYNYMIAEIKKIAKKKDSRVAIKDPKTEITFNLKWHGPDWEGFLANVQQSNVKDKNAILNVIRSAAPSKREEEIRNMILIYPEIEENMLPPLRRTVIAVNCYEPKRPDEQIKAYAMQYPDSLKVEELLYAATMYDDNESKLKIYKTTFSIYPNCWTAYNNAGDAELAMGNVAGAESMFRNADSKSPNNGIVKNNLGVIECHKGNYESAESYFKNAQQLGENVNYNLGTLEILHGNFSKALQLFGSTKCKYNVGLAQLMSGNTSAAESTLKCAPQHPETYYLLAIVGSRTDNTSLMYEYLGKAISGDPQLAARAKDDREFIKYFNAPEFQAIVQ
ncbi:MAG: hypothetical protein KKA81_04990 [Bacteroidetes bacterium]|nr:hypothetical protein [Bacteroidota bacterium]